MHLYYGTLSCDAMKNIEVESIDKHGHFYYLRRGNILLEGFIRSRQ